MKTLGFAAPLATDSLTLSEWSTVERVARSDIRSDSFLNSDSRAETGGRAAEPRGGEAGRRPLADEVEGRRPSFSQSWSML